MSSRIPCFKRWCADEAKESGTPALHRFTSEKVIWQSFVGEEDGSFADIQDDVDARAQG